MGTPVRRARRSRWASKAFAPCPNHFREPRARGSEHRQTEMGKGPSSVVSRQEPDLRHGEFTEPPRIFRCEVDRSVQLEPNVPRELRRDPNQRERMLRDSHAHHLILRQRCNRFNHRKDDVDLQSFEGSSGLDSRCEPAPDLEVSVDEEAHTIAHMSPGFEEVTDSQLPWDGSETTDAREG